MGWTAINFPETTTPVFRSFGQGVQLLNDGRVLLLTSTGAWVLSPDVTGSYKNGVLSEFKPVFNPLLAGRNGANTILQSNGLVTVWGGHASQNNPAEKTVDIFDPKQSRFVSAIDTASMLNFGVSHEIGGGPCWDSSINKIGKLSSIGFAYFDETDNTLKSIPQYGGYVGEAGVTQMPDNSYLEFPCGPFGLSRSINKYSNGQKSSFNLTRPNVTHSRAWAWEVSDNPNSPHYCHPYTDEDNLGYNGVFRELPSNIWMPKIGRLVQIGADNSLWVYDPNTNTAVCNTINPNAITPTSFNLIGGLTNIHNNQTISQLLSSNSISYIIQPNSRTSFVTKHLRQLCIRTSDGKAIVVRGTGTRVNGVTVPETQSVLVLSVGDTVELVGPFTQRWGTSSGSFITGSEVNTYWPWPLLCESWSGILPNGSLCFMQNMSNTVGGIWTNHNDKFVMWDGSNWSFEDTPTELQSSNSNTTNPLVLPNGELLVAYSSIICIRDADLSPDPSARPTITPNHVSSVKAGETFTLEGTQLHGLHVGTTFGDEFTSTNNHPIVQITHSGTGRVIFCPTTNYNTRSIAPNLTSTCSVEVPIWAPAGHYTMTVSSAGNVSEPRNITVEKSQAGDPIFIPYR